MENGADRIAKARARERDLVRLGEEIAELAAHIDAATHRLLGLIREFDEREGWGNGFASCAHWLNWRVGLSLVAAREKVRVARALAELPKTSEAFGRGLVSYSKVRAITRIATPAIEEDLLAAARAGTASHVEKLVRGYRRANRPEERARATRQHEERYLRMHTDEDGMLVVEGRLSPEVGAALVKAIDAAVKALAERANDSAESSVKAPAGQRPNDSAESSPSTRLTPPPSWSQRRADALGLLAESALAADLARGSGAERALVVVHVDKEVLADPNLDGRSELEEGPEIAPDVARRIACDAARVEVTHGPDGSVLDVGRKSRSLPTRLRRALQARDEGCRFPGCTRTRYLEGHHVKHWADGGETRLDNLLHLCWVHHRAVHEGGFEIERGPDSGFSFRDPRGRILPPSFAPVTLPADPPGALVARNRTLGIAVTAADTRGTWMGERVDYDWGVLCLFAAQRRWDSQRGNDRAAPPSDSAESPDSAESSDAAEACGG
jgi:hypothetical protein